MVCAIGQHAPQRLLNSPPSLRMPFLTLLLIWLGALSVECMSVARQDGDVMIGILLPMHRSGKQTFFSTRCGEIWEQYGIHRLEQVFRTFDDINRSKRLLPDVTLGYDIRDSCWSISMALRQCIDFIRNKIASLDRAKGSDLDQIWNQTATENPLCTKLAESDLPVSNKPIAALLGPGSSGTSTQIQNVLQLFAIPQMGYSATSMRLSDKRQYKTFMRVVPSDKQQARAMLDVVLHYNWTYISTVYTNGDYGKDGMDEFREEVLKTETCLAKELKISKHGLTTDADYDNVVAELYSKPNARVVVCFCNGATVTGLYRATQRKGIEGHFLILGSDGWGDRNDVVKGVEDAALGGMSIKLHSPFLKDFDKHLFSLNPFNNTRNPWFKEFWMEKFNCRFQDEPYNGPHDIPKNNFCTGNENLATNFTGQDSKLGHVINAIYALAYGLDAMRDSVCGEHSKGLCAKMGASINGTIYQNFLLNVSFVSYSGSVVQFDSKGDGPGRYDIMNYQRLVTNSTALYTYRKIGAWDSGNLTMNDSLVYWAKSGFGRDWVQSVCSPPCPPGQIKKLTGGIKCCWVCTACAENDILVDEYKCRNCSLGWWPNDEKSACLMIDIQYIRWSDKLSMLAVAFSILGILTSAWVLWVFFGANSTPVVKSSTRELMYIILLGIFMAYLSTFPILARPSMVSCYFSRILPGFSLAFIYGALVTKTNRIARILAGSKKKIMTRKPRFLSASAQIVITSLVIGVESAIITGMMIIEPAEAILVYPTRSSTNLICNTSKYGLFVPMGFNFLLIVLCTLYAVRTRKLPENFNESKFIGFCMYTTCVIWMSFMPFYFGSDYRRAVIVCLAVSCSASVALALLFGPKVYIIIWKPEKNNRSMFTTAGKDIRCHLGSKGTDSHDMKSMDSSVLAVMRSKRALSRWRQVLNAAHDIRKIDSSPVVENTVASRVHGSPAGGGSGVDGDGATSRGAQGRACSAPLERRRGCSLEKTAAGAMPKVASAAAGCTDTASIGSVTDCFTTASLSHLDSTGGAGSAGTGRDRRTSSLNVSPPTLHKLLRRTGSSDNFCQADLDLLESLIPLLRKRKRELEWREDDGRENRDRARGRLVRENRDHWNNELEVNNAVDFDIDREERRSPEMRRSWARGERGVQKHRGGGAGDKNVKDGQRNRADDVSKSRSKSRDGWRWGDLDRRRDREGRNSRDDRGGRKRAALRDEGEEIHYDQEGRAAFDIEVDEDSGQWSDRRRLTGGRSKSPRDRLDPDARGHANLIHRASPSPPVQRHRRSRTPAYVTRQSAAAARDDPGDFRGSGSALDEDQARDVGRAESSFTTALSTPLAYTGRVYGAEFDRDRGGDRDRNRDKDSMRHDPTHEQMSSAAALARRVSFSSPGQWSDLSSSSQVDLESTDLVTFHAMPRAADIPSDDSDTEVLISLSAPSPTVSKHSLHTAANSLAELVSGRQSPIKALSRRGKGGLRQNKQQQQHRPNASVPSSSPTPTPTPTTTSSQGSSPNTASSSRCSETPKRQSSRLAENDSPTQGTPVRFPAGRVPKSSLRYRPKPHTVSPSDVPSLPVNGSPSASHRPNPSSPTSATDPPMHAASTPSMSSSYMHSSRLPVLGSIISSSSPGRASPTSSVITGTRSSLQGHNAPAAADGVSGLNLNVRSVANAAGSSSSTHSLTSPTNVFFSVNSLSSGNSAAGSASGNTPIVSLEDLSQMGLTLLEEEEHGFERLQQYLLARGIRLDINELQSADV